jgi:hypothetical protein
MRLLAVSIGRFGGGSVRSMSNMSRRPGEPVSVISTARMLRLGVGSGSGSPTAVSRAGLLVIGSRYRL